MGRHRSDPMGVARLALIGLGVALLVALVLLGGRALVGILSTEGTAPTPTATPSAPATGKAPTLRITCVAEVCPAVLVRVPGGDVLNDRDLTSGEEIVFYQPELDVAIDDTSTVEVTVNGVPRPKGQPGRQETFTVSRPTPGPAG
ncbi:DUF4115 domain-containing protein [Nonomuraea africana]|uniref:DUF4115 domain-containing protein n=1 Tax=Nonomuraea africana TaxID=46171 RepID=UPI0034064577